MRENDLSRKGGPDPMNTMVFLAIMDVIGTAAFAVSGAVVAIGAEMDIFGVNILAVTAATGGGMFRDLLIGRTPPAMFRDPLYVILAVVSANLVFLAVYLSRREMRSSERHIYDLILFWFDTLGLAAFTVDGVYVAWQYGQSSVFLMVFLGVITGVGGGILRDILARQTPYIFVKHIYACAAIAGALTTALMFRSAGLENAMVLGAVVIVVIRVCAAHFKWNLPRIRHRNDL